jgi:hypothetical protein
VMKAAASRVRAFLCTLAGPEQWVCACGGSAQCGTHFSLAALCADLGLGSPGGAGTGNRDTARRIERLPKEIMMGQRPSVTSKTHRFRPPYHGRGRSFGAQNKNQLRALRNCPEAATHEHTGTHRASTCTAWAECGVFGTNTQQMVVPGTPANAAPQRLVQGFWMVDVNSTVRACEHPRLLPQDTAPEISFPQKAGLPWCAAFQCIAISLRDVDNRANPVGFEGLLPLLPDFCQLSVSRFHAELWKMCG